MKTITVRGCCDCNFCESFDLGYGCSLTNEYVYGGDSGRSYDDMNGQPPDWCPLRSGDVTVRLESEAVK